jgi:hypothetical protein
MHRTAIILHYIPATIWVALVCVAAFGILYMLFWNWNRGRTSFYSDPQDFVHYEDGGGRELPVAAATNTFAPFLDNYTDVTKLMITVAAASIAFGGGSNPSKGVVAAKVILAFSVLYGVLFAALLLFFYDDYCQNVRAHTRFRYSLNEALGFSTLFCFVVGYLVWAFNIS